MMPTQPGGELMLMSSRSSASPSNAGEYAEWSRMAAVSPALTSDYEFSLAGLLAGNLGWKPWLETLTGILTGSAGHFCSLTLNTRSEVNGR
jgi:hypothetical protein